MDVITTEQIRQKLSFLLLGEGQIEAPVLVEGQPTGAVVRHLRGAQQILYLVWLSLNDGNVTVKRIIEGGPREHLAIAQATAAPGGVRLQICWWRQGNCTQRAWLFEETGTLPKLR